MIFTETKLKGAFIIEPEFHSDLRGAFARIWCEREFRDHGLNARLVQCSVSLNNRRGVLRGMHYQVAPYQETKLIRCTQGAIYDVIIDLRRDSPTFKCHVEVELTANNHKMFYVPEGFAHGFEALQDNSAVAYQMSEFYMPEYARGVRWDDPAFGIVWPIAQPIMLDRDRNYPGFSA